MPIHTKKIVICYTQRKIETEKEKEKKKVSQTMAERGIFIKNESKKK